LGRPLPARGGCCAVSRRLTPAQALTVARPHPLAQQRKPRQALDSGDEHIIKFTETALQAERRGFAAGRAAAAHALQIIPADG